jgi:hypothetical protein
MSNYIAVLSRWSGLLKNKFDMADFDHRTIPPRDGTCVAELDIELHFLARFSTDQDLDNGQSQLVSNTTTHRTYNRSMQKSSDFF